MKRFAFVLTAFLVQSCYTVLYTANEYADYNGVSPVPPQESVVIFDRPYYPCIPPPLASPAAAATFAESQPLAEPPRPRTEGVTRDPVTASPASQGSERVRTSSPQPVTVSPTVRGNAQPERERATAQPQNQRPQ